MDEENDQLKTLILILPNLRLILYLETNIVGTDRRESISVFGTVYLRDHVNINLWARSFPNNEWTEPVLKTYFNGR